MRKFLYLSLFLIPQYCLAQFVETSNIYISPNKGAAKESPVLLFQREKPISSISIKILEQKTFEGSFITCRNDTFFLSQDEHGSIPGEKISNLIIFPVPVYSFQFHYASINDSLRIFLINDVAKESAFSAPDINISKSGSSTFQMPKMIAQQIWREGLTSPDYERIVHEVHNVILHHSATSNLVTDYTTAIRNIYLYHTEVRGWSDIGYNYVIAGNGDIYKGRDPGANEQDLVMGAHFCSSNSGTMGICMLGTFTEIAPTDTAFASLEKLLVWKLGKDEMDALGQYTHPLNPELNVISGHRDGCATECPGEIMYSRLALMRNLVHNKILILGIELINEKSLSDDIHFYPNPAENQLFLTSPKVIESVAIISLEGKILKQYEYPGDELDLSNLKKGAYILIIRSNGQEFSRRIIKR